MVSKCMTRGIWFGAGLLALLTCWTNLNSSTVMAADQEAVEWTADGHWPKMKAWVSALAYDGAGQLLAVGQRDEVILFDAATRTEKTRLTGKLGPVTALQFSPNGQVLAVGGYQTLQLWTVSPLQKLADFPGHRGAVTDVAFSPDGQKLVSTSDDETALLWSVADRKSVPLAGHSYPVNGVAWTANGQNFVTVAGDELRPTKAGETCLRDAQGAVLKTWTDHTRASLSAAFSNDGKLLVTGGMDERALVYDLAADQLLGFFGGHQRPVNAVEYIPGQEIVVSIGGGRAQGGHTVRAWRPRNGEELAVGESHTAKILALAVHPQGTEVVTGGQDQTLLSWKLDVIPTAKEATPPVAETILLAANAAAAEPAAPAVIRVGVIGLDTSHAPAFAKLLNDPQAAADVAGCKIVAAYPKGSPDIPSSTERVPSYTKQFQEMGIEIVDSIPALLEKVDCVLLETNDGRPHLEQVLPVLKAGKKCFIDKPVAGSLADAIAIYEASAKYGVPVFSSSSLRFTPTALEARQGKVGAVMGCDAYSPCSLEATHPDLFWYGIHGVEILFTVMGKGCESVSRTHTPGFDFAVGTWSGGRIGTFRGIRQGASGYGGQVFGEKGKFPIGEFGGYRPLAVEIVKFFKTGEVPVSPEETLEIYAFMEAADESKRQGGVPVKLADVMAKAKAAVKLPE